MARGINAATDITGCKVWLRASSGITTVDAAVADGTDISTVNWAPVNLSARTATKMTCAVDAGAVLHNVMGTVTNQQLTNHPTTVSLDFKADVGATRMYVSLGAAGGYVQLATGTVDTQTACVITTVPLGGGWYRLTQVVAAPSNNNLTIFPAKPNTTFQSDGTDTMYVTNISVTQRNVSSWQDWTGTNVAALVGGTDLTNGAWTQLHAVNRTATRIVSDAGTAASYWVGQTAIAGMVSGRPCTVTFDVGAGTVNYVYVTDATFTWGVYCNATNGTVVSSYGCTVTSLGAVAGGLFRFSVFAPSTTTYLRAYLSQSGRRSGHTHEIQYTEGTPSGVRKTHAFICP